MEWSVGCAEQIRFSESEGTYHERISILITSEHLELNLHAQSSIWILESGATRLGAASSDGLFRRLLKS